MPSERVYLPHIVHRQLLLNVLLCGTGVTLAVLWFGGKHLPTSWILLLFLAAGMQLHLAWRCRLRSYETLLPLMLFILTFLVICGAILIHIKLTAG